MPWWAWVLVVWGVLAVALPVWWVLVKPTERRRKRQQPMWWRVR